jgi:hygromycin-B 7''-O-kinase
MGVLPSVRTEEDLAAICQDEAALQPGIERLCRLLGVNADGLTGYPAGSRPVYATGDLVLKLFPPVASLPDYQVEVELLAALAGRLPTPTPHVHAAAAGTRPPHTRRAS